MQPYLLPNNDVTNEMARFLFKARSSNLNLRGNFKKQFKNNLFCQGCLDKNKIESQRHIFLCSSLTHGEIIDKKLQYDDLFLSDLQKMLHVGKILKHRVAQRELTIKTRK